MKNINCLKMVSYYNSLAMYRQQQQTNSQQSPSLTSQAQQHIHHQAQAQQHAVAAAAAAAVVAADGNQQYWYGYSHGHSHSGHPHHHHQTSPGSQQYLDHTDVLHGWSTHHAAAAAHHYSHHLQQYPQHHQYPHQQSVADWSGDEGAPNPNGIGTSEPSPPITVSGSEISSPGTPCTPPSHNNNNVKNNNNNTIIINNNHNTDSTPPMRPNQIRSPFEWMKKPSYQSQPNPGKTRTKDKYRVVYTDHQRLELEKEFHYSRYITIRRKAELAANLALSERQVKIWFQNRRAKERKQVKKREELVGKDIKPQIGEGLPTGGMASLASLSGVGGVLGSLMHNGGSPPLNLGSSTLALSHAPTSLHSHTYQHAHPHTVLGL